MVKYLLIVLSVLCLLFAYLSYSFYGSKIEAERALVAALASNSSLKSSLDKKLQECKIADELSAEWQQEKQEADKQKEDDLEKIDRIPPKPPIVRSEAHKNEEINIDSSLPSELISVLSEAFNRNKGSASNDSR